MIDNRIHHVGKWGVYYIVQSWLENSIFFPCFMTQGNIKSLTMGKSLGQGDKLFCPGLQKKTLPSSRPKTTLPGLTEELGSTIYLGAAQLEWSSCMPHTMNDRVRADPDFWDSCHLMIYNLETGIHHSGIRHQRETVARHSTRNKSNPVNPGKWVTKKATLQNVPTTIHHHTTTIQLPLFTCKMR